MFIYSSLFSRPTAATLYFYMHGLPCSPQSTQTTKKVYTLFPLQPYGYFITPPSTNIPKSWSPIAERAILRSSIGEMISFINP